MAVIKKDELKKMTKKDAEKRLAELEKALLEVEGEGKREMRKPLKRAIAQLKTVMNAKTGEKPSGGQGLKSPSS